MPKLKALYLRKLNREHLKVDLENIPDMIVELKEELEACFNELEKL